MELTLRVLVYFGDSVRPPSSSIFSARYLGIGYNSLERVFSGTSKIEFKNLLFPLHSINSFVKSAIDESSNDKGRIMDVRKIMIKPRNFKRV
jgi:hypothetical protein